MNGFLPSPASAAGRFLRTLAAGVALASVFSGEEGIALAQAPAPQPPAAAPGPAPTPAGPAGATPAAPPGAAAPGTPPPPLAESPLTGPKIDLTVPEPGPSVVRKLHNHDGFYFRGSVGFSWSRAFVAPDSSNASNYTVNGGGISLDLLVGGTPAPSLAVGGGAMLQSISDPEVHLDNGKDVGSGSGGMLLVGPFVDGFPMSNGGTHLGALLGFAGGSTRRQGADDDFSGGGFGAAAWFGQGFWVGDEVSLGFVLKLDAAFLRDGSGPVVLTDTIYGGSLSVSVLYH